MSNASSPSVLEEKCSKNEHDAVPVGLSVKALHNPRSGELASLDDTLFVNGKSNASGLPEGDDHSEEISVVSTQCSLYIFGNIPLPACNICICTSEARDLFYWKEFI